MHKFQFDCVKGRRYRIIRFAPELLLYCCRESMRPFRCIKGVPEDARLVSWECDAQRGFSIVIESEEFDMLHETALIPLIDVELEAIDDAIAVT